MKAKSATRERATKPAFAKRSTSLSSPTKLKIGLPKGSLQEATAKLFGRAGFSVVISERSYMPSIDDPELEPMLLRAQEMSRYVEGGLLDCGITGHDWILENGSQVQRVAELRYAKRTAHPVRWVLAVAAASPIRALSDLNGKRIATELVHVTKSYLATHGVRAKVEFSWGATEAKVVEGLVDAIVEVTETGTTIRANKLKIIHELMKTNTKLIANRDAWKDPWKKQKIEQIRMLLNGSLEAMGKVGLKMNVSRENLARLVVVLPSLKAPTISGLYSEDWLAVETIVNANAVRDLIPLLKEAGAEGIIEYPLNKVI